MGGEDDVVLELLSGLELTGDRRLDIGKSWHLLIYFPAHNRCRLPLVVLGFNPLIVHEIIVRNK